MSFQAEVGAALAAQMLASSTVGQRFGLSHSERVTSIRFETLSGVDDVVAELTGGGHVKVQCKTSLNVSGKEKSEFDKTIAQCVDECLANPDLDPGKSALVIAVPHDAPATLDTLLSACERVAAGGLSELEKGSAQERELFARFKTCVDRNYTIKAPSVSPDYVLFSRLIRVVRYDRGPSGQARIDASALLGRALYGGEDKGGSPQQTLINIVRDRIADGIPASRQQLLDEMRRRGAIDVSAPGFEADIERLLNHNKIEQAKLDAFGALPLSGYRLRRSSENALLAAAQQGSFLLVGEPGAGKSGSLGCLARSWEGVGPIVLLSVETFSSVTGLQQLSSEVGLEHGIVDVLSAWPGNSPGLVIIDALDAARGGSAEAVFIYLIEKLTQLAPRWRVVASVRTFDLFNGQRLRRLLPGKPPVDRLADPRAADIRHLALPSLDGEELATLSKDVPKLEPLITSENAQLAPLLKNIFNLSIAADLVARGARAETFTSLSTQSDLVDAYLDCRLGGSVPARNAMIQALSEMVSKGRLLLRVAELDHPGLTELLASGIIVERDDSYSFAHHILFDHAAGRYFIANNDADTLIEQLSDLGAKAFVLAPALRFALERFWRKDSSDGHASTWALILKLAQARELGPVAAASALRIAIECVKNNADLTGLYAAISDAQPEPMSRTLFHLARFLAMRVETDQIPPDALEAWATLALRLARSGELLYLEPARFLLWPIADLLDQLNDGGITIFGEAARVTLKALSEWGPQYRNARGALIDFVARSWESDIEASREAFRLLLSPDWMELHGHEDGHRLAGALKSIIPADAEFAAPVFDAVFTTPIPDDTPTQMTDSRILGLSSTRRQDFEHSFWVIDQAFVQILKQAPVLAPRLFTIAAIARASKREEGIEEIQIASGDSPVTILQDGHDLFDWRQRSKNEDASNPKIPRAFADHVAEADDEELCRIIVAAQKEKTAASVWRRLFGGQLDSDRRGAADDLLWPIATQPLLIESPELGRDAIDYLASVYPTRTAAERETFEKSTLAHEPEDDKRWGIMLARLLSALPQDALITESMRLRRAELEREDALEGNPAAYSFGTPNGRVLRAGEGSQPKSTAAKLVTSTDRAASKLNEKATPKRLASLWRAILCAEEHAASLPPDDPYYPDLWGAISQAYVEFVGCDLLEPDEEGAPKLERMVEFARTLSANVRPRADEGNNASVSWSNTATRVHAAQAVMQLAHRWHDRAPELSDLIDSLIGDNAANVRFAIVQRLSWIAKKAPADMWRHIEEIAKEEKNLSILAALVAYPLARLFRSEQGKVEAVLQEIESRGDIDPSAEEGNLDDMVAQLVGRLAIVSDSQTARSMIDEWTHHPVASDKLSQMFQNMREDFFVGYSPGKDPPPLQGTRAHDLAAKVVASCQVQLSEAKRKLQEMPFDEPSRKEVEEAYVGADRVLDQIVSQLYFGSGAYKDRDSDKAALRSKEEKLAFLSLWSETLDAIEAVATPHTIKYLLEFYEHLLDADPPRLFKRIAAFVTGPAASEYYQGEALAAKDLVEFVRKILADYRDLFDDQEQRERLVSILSLFADAGWPEAMRLLWELPELLR